MYMAWPPSQESCVRHESRRDSYWLGILSQGSYRQKTKARCRYFQTPALPPYWNTRQSPARSLLTSAQTVRGLLPSMCAMAAQDILSLTRAWTWKTSDPASEERRQTWPWKV